jgi:hypothetical protein
MGLEDLSFVLDWGVRRVSTRVVEEEDVKAAVMTVVMMVVVVSASDEPTGVEVLRGAAQGMAAGCRYLRLHVSKAETVFEVSELVPCRLHLSVGAQGGICTPTWVAPGWQRTTGRSMEPRRLDTWSLG